MHADAVPTGPAPTLTAPPGQPATEVLSIRGPMTPVVYRVVERRDDGPDVVTLGLTPVGASISEPAPGQFTMLWSFGVGEAPISLARFADGVLWHTIRRVGAVTNALCDLSVDDELGVRGPFGRGWPVDDAVGGDLVVVAGGLGVAPVRPIIDRAIADRGAFRRVVVLFGARDPEGLLYQDEYDTWRRHDIDLDVTVDVSTREWAGEVGLVTRLVERADFDGSTATAFVCGPEVMMRFVARSLLARATPPESILVSLERNMHCAIGHCGRCQLGPAFVCRNGPVFDWGVAAPLLQVKGW